MNTLIVYSHPNRDSLCGAFLNSTLKGIENSAEDHQVQILDLYQDHFNPVLVFHKDKRRRDMHKDPDFERYREQIQWAERLVFIYPIFWARPPAMLLGYFDQLFASDFAYQDVKGKMLPKGLLGGKRVVVISTMKGPTNYIQFTLKNAHKTLLRKALFQFVGIKKVKFFEFGSMERQNGKQREKLEKVERYFAQ